MPSCIIIVMVLNTICLYYVVCIPVKFNTNIK